ncbi:polymorphic toxin-type HINT domain-containing protein [Streptomyces koyangensis]
MTAPFGSGRSRLPSKPTATKATCHLGHRDARGYPFRVLELNTWLGAGQLRPGQWPHASAGNRVQITAVSTTTQRATVHSLTVADVHTYYVLAGATPVLVHNRGNASVDELAEAAAGPYKKAKIDTRTGKIARGQSNAGRAL